MDSVCQAFWKDSGVQLPPVVPYMIALRCTLMRPVHSWELQSSETSLKLEYLLPRWLTHTAGKLMQAGADSISFSPGGPLHEAVDVLMAQQLDSARVHDTKKQEESSVPFLTQAWDS